MTKRTLVLLALALGACKEPRTQIMAGLATDLAAPLGVDEVSLEVLVDGVAAFDQTWPLAIDPPDGQQLPGSVALVPGGDDNETFTMVARARRDGATIIRRSSTVSFVPGETLFIRLGLVQSCEGAEDLCPTGHTCVEGGCKPADIDSKTLPVWQDGLDEKVSCNSGTAFLRTGAGIETRPMEAEGACDPTERCQEGSCYRPPTTCASYCSRLSGCAASGGYEEERGGGAKAPAEAKPPDAGVAAGVRRHGYDAASFEEECVAQCTCLTADCSLDEMEQADACLAGSCEDFDAWQACVEAIPCIGSLYGGCSTGGLEGESEAEAECPPDYDDACVWQNAYWVGAGSFGCTPGARVQIDCRNCTGDPMLQVRDPEGGACIDDDDDACSNLCPTVAFDCPAAGAVDVYTAPYGSTSKGGGNKYTCSWSETF